MQNRDIARIFEQIAALLELEGGNPFRIRSFRRAAETLQTLSFRVDRIMEENPERLSKVPGVGAGTMQRIGEILETGGCRELTRMAERVPLSLLDLLRVSTLGPKKVKRIWSELGIKTLEELQAAAAEGRLRGLPGMGVKSEEKILGSIELLLSTRGRHRLDHVRKAAAAIVGHLEEGVDLDRIAVAGSLRRWKETVRDIDILVTSKKPGEVVKTFLQYPEVTEILANGPTRASVRLDRGPGCDLRIVAADQFGAALQYFTGSREHNVALREYAKRKGYGLAATGSDASKSVNTASFAPKTEKEPAEPGRGRCTPGSGCPSFPPRYARIEASWNAPRRGLFLSCFVEKRYGVSSTCTRPLRTAGTAWRK